MRAGSHDLNEVTMHDTRIAPQNGQLTAVLSKKFYFLFALAAVIFLISTFLGVQYILNNLLTQKSHTIGMSWAHHIETQIPKAGAIAGISEAKQAPSEQERAKLIKLIEGMFSIGNIYQIDLINPDCHCNVTFGTFSDNRNVDAHNHHGQKTDLKAIPKPQMIDHSDHTSTALSDANSAKPPQNVEHQHSFERNSSFKELSESDKSWPLDQAFINNLTVNSKHPIHIESSQSLHHPSTFGIVYHLVIADNKIKYVIRVLVDLEAAANRYSIALYGGAAFVFLLLLAVTIYPATKYIRTTEIQRKTDLRAYYLATHDVLTGIYNRNAFQEFAPKILRTSCDNRKSAVLFLFDLNKFKEVNDYYSHHAGDQLLAAFAKALEGALPKNGYVARLGGDEFVAIIPDVDDDQSIEDVMDVPQELTTVIDEGRQTIHVTVSAGVAVYPKDGSNINELMRNADLALYAAKAQTNEKLCTYDPDMGKVFNDRLDLRDEFKTAILGSEIEPFYQPIVDIHTGNVEGFEALVRWRHPKRGILSPVIFGEMLDNIELSAMVGDIMFEKVVSDMAKWKSQGLDYGIVGINAGEGDLIRPGFSLNILATLAKHNIPASSFAIEVIETCMFGNNKDMFINHLQNLRDAGCKIALDDFGTGYSSITQIKDLPCSTVKIDRSFVSEVVNSTSDRAIIQALINLGQELEFSLIMEGIETKEQLDVLISIGATQAQGYYFSRPVSADQVPNLLKAPNEVQKRTIIDKSA